jgi:drug/metabolite transporter (DMT)-like permease
LENPATAYIVLPVLHSAFHISHSTLLPVSYLLLIFGVFTGSTAFIWIKTSTLPPAYIGAGRLWLAATLLYPLFRRAVRQHPEIDLHATLRRAIAPGIFMGLHMISWTAGARMTAATNATLIVNLAPIAMPFLLYFLASERITKTEACGTLLAVTGVVVLTLAELKMESSHWLGNLTCFVSMLFMATYMALGRRNRDIPSLWLYMIPLYSVACVVALVWGLLVNGPPTVVTKADWTAIVCLALIPTILGHTILNFSMKKLSGQTVSVFNLHQFVFSGVLAAVLLHEHPKPIFYGSCVLIVSGAALALSGKAPTPRAEEFPD